jgi:hypothetical protein
MISDLRAHYRLSVRVPGNLYADLQAERSARVIVRELSCSGLGIETLENLEPGQDAVVQFEVGGRYVFARAPVVVLRHFRRPGGAVTALGFRQGEDRRRARQALMYLIENTN